MDDGHQRGGHPVGMRVLDDVAPVHVFMFALLVLAVLACGSSDSRPAATSAPSEPEPFTALLWCEDCADVGMDINLWDSPDRDYVTGSLPHNTIVSVLDCSFGNLT
jgi:hypothetical protein